MGFFFQIYFKHLNWLRDFKTFVPNKMFFVIKASHLKKAESNLEVTKILKMFF